MKGAVGMAGTRMVTMRQRHGDTILDVAEPCKEAGEGDAMVTDAPGVFLGVLTADCVPIVCWARTSDRRVAAVIHAGWRGTLAGVALKTVRHIESRYGTAPGELACALGPGHRTVLLRDRRGRGRARWCGSGGNGRRRRCTPGTAAPTSA